ncbi:MAG: hypothetical protein EOO07_23290, partial [Chitinophagaceae bacterium]
MSKGKGDITNAYNKDQTYTNKDRVSGKVQFLLTPSEDFTARFSFDAQPRAGETTNQRTIYKETPATYADGSINALSTDNKTRLTRRWFTQDANYSYTGNYLNGGGNDEVNNDTQRPLITGSNGATAELNWRLSDFTLTSITAYKDYHFNAVNDEGTPFDVMRNSGGFFNDYKQVSEEIRFSSPTGGFVDYQTGLFFLNVHNDAIYQRVWGNDAGSWFANPTQYTSLDADSNGLYDNNIRFNEETIRDWQGFLGKNTIGNDDLKSLLFSLSSSAIDSVNKQRLGFLKSLPSRYPNLAASKFRKKNVDQFFSYLTLAKEAEFYAVDEENYWYDAAPKKNVPASIESKLKSAFANAKEPFIKQRYWFQLVRYYFFKFRSSDKLNQPVEATFNLYKEASPKNNIYYRSLGYLAGYYYGRKEYAKANYLYSICYDYSYKHKIPAAWSFKPQEEKDWQQTLKLAKSKDEQITLWHLLGIEHDPARALKEIVALDPKSEKADLLLTRLINVAEEGSYGEYYEGESRKKGSEDRDLKITDSITRNASVPKPWFWNMASGYLHYLKKDYSTAAIFYGKAEKQIPGTDKY